MTVPSSAFTGRPSASHDRFRQREERAVQQPGHVGDQQRAGHRVQPMRTRARCGRRCAQPVEHPAVFASTAKRLADRRSAADASVESRRRSRAITTAARAIACSCARRRARSAGRAAAASPASRPSAARRCGGACVARSGALRIAQAPAPLPASSAVTKFVAARRTHAICSARADRVRPRPAPAGSEQRGAGRRRARARRRRSWRGCADARRARGGTRARICVRDGRMS